MTVACVGVLNSDRVAWRSLSEARGVFADTGQCISWLQTLGYILGSVLCVNWLLHRARSGGVSRAQSCSQSRPLTALWSQKTSGRWAKRATGPKIACGHAEWQTTISILCCRRTSFNTRLDRHTESGLRTRTLPRRRTPAPTAANSSPQSPSKQKAKYWAKPAHRFRRRATVVSSVLLPPAT